MSTHITPARSHEILCALAEYHEILSRVPAATLLTLDQSTEERTLRAFYKEFPDCKCPSDAILQCILNDLSDKPSHHVRPHHAIHSY